MGQQRVGGDIERHAEEDVAAPLIQLAGKLTVGNVELEKCVAGHESHAIQFTYVPGAYDDPPRIGVIPQHPDRLVDLIHGAPVPGRPRTPLGAVDRAEIAVLVGPLVPDRHAVVVEIRDVGVACEKPQQLVDDRLQMELLRRHEREAAAQIETHLVPENRQRAGPCTIVLARPVIPHVTHHVEILLHTAPRSQ